MTPTQLETIKGEFDRDIAEYCTCDTTSGTGFRCEKCRGKAYYGENPDKKVFQFIESKLKEVEESKNTAYWERNQLVLALTRLYPSYRTTHGEDPSWEQDWLNIVVIDLPTGQASWHIHGSEMKYFNHLKLKPNNWDGHSTEEKYQRLSNLKSNKLKEPK